MTPVKFRILEMHENLKKHYVNDNGYTEEQLDKLKGTIHITPSEGYDLISENEVDLSVSHDFGCSIVGYEWKLMGFTIKVVEV